MVKKIAQNILDVLIDNLVLMITIGYALYIAYQRDIAKENFSVEQLLTAIIWLLSLLATSEIIERYRKLNVIQKSVDKSVAYLESRLAERPSAMAFFQRPPELRPFLQKALQIDLCGVTLTGTLNKEYGTIRERLQAGAKVRVLIIDPDSLAIEMTAQRTANPIDLEYHRTRLDASLRELAYMYKRMSDFKPPKGIRPGSLSVRLMPYAPSFGILSMDAKQKDGNAFVEIFPHKFGYMTPIVFELTPERDQDWYDYFNQQFEVMWDAAKPWDQKTYLDKILFTREE